MNSVGVHVIVLSGVGESEFVGKAIIVSVEIGNRKAVGITNGFS
jgi:hypothetical protein